MSPEPKQVQATTRGEGRGLLGRCQYKEDMPSGTWQCRLDASHNGVHMLREPTTACSVPITCETPLLRRLACEMEQLYAISPEHSPERAVLIAVSLRIEELLTDG